MAETKIARRRLHQLRWVYVLILLFYFNQFAHAANTWFVPSQIATIQQAIDLAQNGDTIRLEMQTFEDQSALITNKKITIKGVTPSSATSLKNINQKGFANIPVILNSRFTPYSIRVEGNSDVTIEDVGFIGGSHAISVKSLNGVQPNIRLVRVYTAGSVRGFFGEPNHLVVQNSGFSNNEGNGFIARNFKSVLMTHSSFNHNLNYGLVLFDSQPNSLVTIKNINVEYNLQAGSWLHAIHGHTLFSESQLLYNKGYNLQVTDSHEVEVSNLILSFSEYGDLEFSADGLRISQSKAKIQNIILEGNSGNGIVAIGCRENGMSLELVNTMTVQTVDGNNWVSGQQGTCSDAQWNWLERNFNTDSIMRDSFESNDTYGNTCQDRYTGEMTECRAVRGDTWSGGFGTPGF